GLRYRKTHIENVLPLKISVFGNVVKEVENLCLLLAENGFDLGGGPNKKLPLPACPVGVLAGEKTTGGICRFAFYILKRLDGNAREKIVVGYLIEVEIDADELGVVIQHFLEMRHEPDRIDGVAMKAAAELIEDASFSHFPSGFIYYLQ